MLFESSLAPVTDGSSCVDDIRRGETLAWHNAAVTHSSCGQSALLHSLPEVQSEGDGSILHGCGVERMADLAGILCCSPSQRLFRDSMELLVT